MNSIDQYSLINTLRDSISSFLKSGSELTVSQKESSNDEFVFSLNALFCSINVTFIYNIHQV